MSSWRPMDEFDPSKPALVHDQLNDQEIDWKPELYLQHYRQYAHPEFNPGVVEWDGLLLDGWKEPRRARAFPTPVGQPGRRDGCDPVDEREHFIKCPVCGHMIDMRNLGEVLEHEGPHEPPVRT